MQSSGFRAAGTAEASRNITAFGVALMVPTESDGSKKPFNFLPLPTLSSGLVQIAFKPTRKLPLDRLYLWEAYGHSNAVLL